MTSRKRFCEHLVDNRFLSGSQLDQALEIQRISSQPLGTVLVQCGILTEALLLKALAGYYGVSAWDLSKDPPEQHALRMLEVGLCRQYQVMPVSLRGDLLILAMRNPEDIDTIDLVRNITKLRVEPVLAVETRLAGAIESFCGSAANKARSGDVDELVGLAMSEFGVQQDRAALDEVTLSQASARPIVELVNQIIGNAIRARASDIHIEARQNRVDLRYRIDGELVKVRELPVQLHPMILVRLKIMASLDIVEYRLPQDGHFTIPMDGRNVDLRLSIIPNFHGPRAALRILDKSAALKNLDDLGMADHNLSLLRSLIERPYGLFLVTGPTGSGKSTTLYAALDELKGVHRNIMTCEDPVEFDIDGINQSQVHEKVGLTFAEQLRAILRQDPDIVLVGEIRDRETAETAIRAALTGHLVFSTLHCNDAPSAVPRLLEMGVDPYLLSTSLIGVMAQRLVRVLCRDCKYVGLPEASDLSIMHVFGAHESEIWKPGSCKKCHSSGYIGRMGVHEILPITREIAKLIALIQPIEAILERSREYGYRPMQEDALDRVRNGQTTFNEARRFLYFDTICHHHELKLAA